MNYIFFIVFLYIFFGFLLYIFQRRIIFNKSGKPKAPEHYTLEKTKEIYIKTVDNISLLAWLHEGDKNKPILVYFHGLLVLNLKQRNVYFTRENEIYYLLH